MFKFLEKVKITDNGQQYTTYSDLFEESKLCKDAKDSYAYGELLSNGDICIFLKELKHYEGKVSITLIMKDGKTYLIGEKGLIKANKTIIINGKEIELSDESYEELKRSLLD